LFYRRKCCWQNVPRGWLLIIRFNIILGTHLFNNVTDVSYVPAASIIGAISKPLQRKLTNVSAVPDMSPYLNLIVGAHCTHRADDGGSKHLWNVVKFLPHYTAQQPRWQPLLYSPPWEPEISLTLHYFSTLSWFSKFFRKCWAILKFSLFQCRVKMNPFSLLQLQMGFLKNIGSMVKNNVTAGVFHF
jgi:hypothetical protein